MYNRMDVWHFSTAASLFIENSLFLLVYCSDSKSIKAFALHVTQRIFSCILKFPLLKGSVRMLNRPFVAGDGTAPCGYVVNVKLVSYRVLIYVSRSPSRLGL